MSDDVNVRPAKALRLYLEQHVPSEREIQELMRRQGEDRQARWEAAQRANEHKVHELAAAVGGNPADVVWVDHPVDR